MKLICTKCKRLLSLELKIAAHLLLYVRVVFSAAAVLCAIFINHNFSSFSQPQKLIAMNGARDYKLQLL